MDIHIEGLVKAYRSGSRAVRVLDHVDLDVPAHQILTLLGPGGCGKTTLLRCIIGLEAPDDGEIRIGGEIVWSRRKRIAVPPERRGLGMVSRNHPIWPHMTVFDNVAYPLRLRGERRTMVHRKVLRALKRVQLEGLENSAVACLSAGQRQRVALARALVAGPKAILFDEPFGNLEAPPREDACKVLRQAVGDLGITAVYVTHDRGEALALSDSIVVLDGGHVLERAAPREIAFDADRRVAGELAGHVDPDPVAGSPVAIGGRLDTLEDAGEVRGAEARLGGQASPARADSGLAWLLVLIAGFLTLCPVLMLLLGSFSQGMTAFGHFTVATYVAAYADPFLPDVIGNTLAFVLGSTALATALALVLAYLNARTDIPFKPLFTALSIVPMIIPHVLFAISWGLLFNPSDGLVNLLLKDSLNLSAAPFDIYTLQGMILVEGLLNMPIAYLIIAPAMSAFDVSLEESSRVSGAGFWRTLRRVTLPVLRPAILAAGVLCIARCLASYAVPRILGTPGRVDVLTTYLYGMIASGATPDYGRAAALGMGALAASIGLIALHRTLTAEASAFATLPGRGSRPVVIRLGAARSPLFAVIGLLCFLMMVMPVAALLYTSLVPHAMVPGARAFAAMTGSHWIGILRDPASLRALGHSLFLAVAGATLGLTLSLGIARVIVGIRSRAAGFLELLTFLSFSFPGIVIGIGFIWLFAQTPLYGTLTALLLAYVATYLPYGVRALVRGAGRRIAPRRIVAPPPIPGIVSAWVLMATLFMGELGVSVVLSHPGAEVLAVRILDFAGDGRWGELSALGILMILISTALALLAVHSGRRFSRGRPPAG